jgi:hypothetical protein
MGGTLQGGTYHLVALTYFNWNASLCAVPLTVRDTLMINPTDTTGGNATETIMFDFEEASFDQVWSGAYDYSVDGATSTWITSCPEVSSQDQGLTVDGSMLTVSIDLTADGCGTSVWVFEQQ